MGVVVDLVADGLGRPADEEGEVIHGQHILGCQEGEPLYPVQLSPDVRFHLARILTMGEERGAEDSDAENLVDRFRHGLLRENVRWSADCPAPLPDGGTGGAAPRFQQFVDKLFFLVHGESCPDFRETSCICRNFFFALHTYVLCRNDECLAVSLSFLLQIYGKFSNNQTIRGKFSKNF